MNNLQERFSPIHISLILLCLILIQLLFYWLVPYALCLTAVYSYLTAMSFINAAVCYTVWLVKGTRIAVAPMILSTVMTAVCFGIGILMIVCHASVRTAVCALTAGILLYIFVMSVFSCIVS